MARLPFTTWMGHLLKISTPKIMTDDPRGLVLHISDGSRDKKGNIYIPNLGGLAATFNSTNYPAHFGITAQGEMGQYIDTGRQDRATERGTEWFSVECCAFRGMPLTDSQLAAAGFLFALLCQEFKTFPLELADSVSDRGLAYHSLFLTSAELKNPKKHSNCPGVAVIAQRQRILNYAREVF